MAYHNEQGQVTIDEAAAGEDISKIRQAASKLEESKNCIRQLKISVSMMNGQTAAAILEQCEKLETEVNGLINQLNDSINYITKTVQKYKEEDKEL